MGLRAVGAGVFPTTVDEGCTATPAKAKTMGAGNEASDTTRSDTAGATHDPSFGLHERGPSAFQSWFSGPGENAEHGMALSWQGQAVLKGALHQNCQAAVTAKHMQADCKISHLRSDCASIKSTEETLASAQPGCFNLSFGCHLSHLFGETIIQAGMSAACDHAAKVFQCGCMHAATAETNAVPIFELLRLTGIKNARVFPDPVLAAPRRSLPQRAGSMAARWTAVSRVKPASRRPSLV